MNVLILGNNPKHAKIFSLFSNKVYLMLQVNDKDMNRPSKELLDYRILSSELEYGSQSYRIKRHKEIKEAIKKYDIDIVFSNRRDDMIQAKIATSFMHKKPLLLVTFHNSTAWTNDFKVMLMSRLINICADGCICLARFMYEKLSKCRIPQNKLLYLPNTIQFENFIVKDTYKIKKDEKVKLCYTAVIYPLKNQKIIVEAVNILKHKYDFEVHLYGDYIDQDYYNDVLALIDKYSLKNVVFLDGRIDNDEIREKLPTSDIYISSTTIEMSPYNVLEAKASALPIIASNVLGQKDLIEDGIDGILYDVNNVQDLVYKLDLLISDETLRKKIGSNARKAVSQEKSYLVSAEIIKEFIDKLNAQIDK